MKSENEKLVKITKCPDSEKSVISRALRLFKSEFKKKWTAASYKEERFLKHNEQWITVSIQLPYWSVQPTEKPGRPTKTFEELSDRSKRRKTKELREQIPVEELTYAAGVSQRTSGNTDASKIIKEIASISTRATEIRKSITSAQKQALVKKYTPQEALSIFVEGNFTRRQWEVIHISNKSLYPCYSLMKKAKSECYPDKESMQVTETCYEIQLQARGSQQTEYKQRFTNSTDSDANIFQSTLVPLRLVVSVDGETKKIIWQNPVPSSARFCRPIRIRFINESKDVIQDEIAYVRETEVSTSNGPGKIKHRIMLTMVDGKVCNAATDTASTMRCYICGHFSKDFNKLIKSKEVNVEALKFGLSILHARIRFFESLLHLAYKLPLKKWQARSDEEKKVVKEKKEEIQRAFKKELGLLVDVPKAGVGNTNDGNTSRKFFDEPECSSRITGINLDLIRRFKVILEVISSGYSIDAEKYDAYALETAKMYKDLYGWHPMSPTVHKVLMHGALIISNAILPIGNLSEEAAEVRNKHFRQYRLNFARKFSQVKCNRDILNRLLLSSDPYLSSCRPRQHKKKEAVNLMIAGKPNLPQTENESYENTEEEKTDEEEDEADEEEDEADEDEAVEDEADGEEDEQFV
ncbi:unnamed protein product [Brassicogethes aeneus]|uniref:Uncharacterized protein n=1 Tax=Brassicogethes aeneus TaxID=1431903 RepID=A0A9P0FFH7_BRAAE|nr:unnamed protein product [Brassicogethes aeneus]